MRGRLSGVLLAAVSVVAALLYCEAALRLKNPHDIFTRQRSGGVTLCRTSRDKLDDVNPQEFVAEKPPGAIRVFAFGGSTTYGEPWGDRGSFSHFLEERLKQRYPDRPVRVINWGGKGFGSSTVIDLVRESLRYEPDALLFYLGQNEFREALFQPLKRSAFSNVPWKALLHRYSRVLLEVRHHLRAIFGPERPRSTSFAGAQIASILARPFGPESFRFANRLAIPPITPRGTGEAEVLAAFERNLTTIFRIAEAANVPAFALTVLRNEQYWLAPNRSRLRAGAEDRYDECYRRLLDATAAGRFEEATELADSVSALYEEEDDTYLQVLRGDLLLMRQRAGEARAAYRAAWESYDVNATIRAAAEQSGVPIIETRPAATAVAPDSIPGFAVFYDELHPMPVLHRALADTAFSALRAAGVFGDQPPRPAAEPAPLPADPGPDVFVYEALRSLYLNDLASAERSAEEAVRRDPDNGRAHVYAGICAARRGDMKRARQAWNELARLFPELVEE